MMPRSVVVFTPGRPTMPPICTAMLGVTSYTALSVILLERVG
jgi:hypothetical protein